MIKLSLNERRLVELVASHKGIARVELAKKSGMTGASVTRLTASLVEAGIFSEKTEHRGEHGQPKKKLTLKPDRFFSAGITYSLSEMEVAIVDFSGSVVAHSTVTIVNDETTKIAKKAQSEIAEMRKKLSIDENSFVGVGCSAPGNFGQSENSIKAHQLFQDFDDKKKVKQFSEKFDSPFFLENDGSAAALGEYMFRGDNIHGHSIFLIHIGYGLGGGAVIDGKLFRGASGNACLPGVLFPYDEARPTIQDLLQFLSEKDVQIDDINDMTGSMNELQEPLAEWLERAAKQLRYAVRVTSGFFDPSVIIIGGRLPTAINARLVELVTKTPIEGPSRGLEIAPVKASELGHMAGAIGAACIPLFRTFYTGASWDFGSNHLNGRRS